MPEFGTEAMTKLLKDEAVLQKAATEAAEAATEATAAAKSAAAAKKAEQVHQVKAAAATAAAQRKKDEDAHCAKQQMQQAAVAAYDARKAKEAATSLSNANEIFKKLETDRINALDYKKLNDSALLSAMKLPDDTWHPWLSACDKRTLKGICKRLNVSLADETDLLQGHADRTKIVNAARTVIANAKISKIAKSRAP